MRQGAFTPKTNDPDDARRRQELERELGDVATRVFTGRPASSQIKKVSAQPLVFQEGGIYYLGFSIDGTLYGVALSAL